MAYVRPLSYHIPTTTTSIKYYQFFYFYAIIFLLIPTDNFKIEILPTSKFLTFKFKNDKRFVWRRSGSEATFTFAFTTYALATSY